MSVLDGNCPDCGGDQPLERVHAGSGECPDVPGGECPEQACPSCGAAFITGTAPAAAAAESRRPARAA
jgi:hypothetical protein